MGEGETERDSAGQSRSFSNKRASKQQPRKYRQEDHLPNCFRATQKRRTILARNASSGQDERALQNNKATTLFEVPSLAGTKNLDLGNKATER